MNIVIIKGSYHKNGLTNNLVNHFVSGVKSANPGAKINQIDLNEAEINFCIGCEECSKIPIKKIGDCPQKDDARKILEASLKADAVVFATPIYELGPTALMKRFLERCLPMFSSEGKFPRPRNKKIKDKKGLIILSSGCPPIINRILGFTRYSTMLLKFILRAFCCSKIEIVRAGAMESELLKNYYEKKLYKIGRKFGK